MKTVLFILISFFSPVVIGVYADQHQVSSPEIMLSREGRIDSLNSWTENNMESNLKLSLQNSLQALELSKNISYVHGEVESMINLAWIYYRMDNYALALDYAFKGHEKIIKTDHKKLIVRSFFNIGAIYNDGSDQLEQSLSYFQSAHKESLALDDELLTGRALNNIAYTYVRLKRYDEAMELLTPFLLNNKIPSQEAFARRTLGDINLSQGDTAKALDNFQIAYEILQKENSYSTQVSCMNRIAELCLKKDDLYKAKLLLDKALRISVDHKFKDHQVQINQLLSEYHQRQGNWKEAYEYQKTYANLVDSLQNQVNSKNMGRLEAQFDFDQKLEAINTEMELNESLINEKLQQQIFRRNIFLAGFILMLVLVTIILLSTKRIRKSKQLAESANRAKSDFISSMSHEIRTPLNGVIGFSDLLSSTQLDSKQRQYITLINQSAKSLMEIVNDILDFSKIEAGKLEIELAQTDLYNLGIETANLIAYQAHKKNIELILDIDEDIPKFVMADQVRIKQILINLLSNAVKFTSEGEIELKIERLDTDMPESSRVRFTVRDTGRGISHVNQEKIFEAFTQEDSSTTRKFGGTGLGLAISRRLLEMMDSQLKVKSELGNGSTFWCDITFKNIYYQSAKDNKLVPSDIKVLVIEDVKAQAKVILKILRHQNINADHALSEKETLALLRKGNRYDVLLVDFHLSSGDGISLIRKLKDQVGILQDDQKIILMHNSFSEDMDIPNDIQGLLIKPIRKPNLIQTINSLYTKEEAQVTSTEDNYEAENELTNISPTILIAEDNQVNMILTKRMLISLIPGAIIKEAKDGQEAVNMYRENEIDLIFMDIQMPRLNGYEATGAIRKLETIRRVPIIALTAGILNNEKQKCLDAGLDDYTSKPMNKMSIKNALLKWLTPKVI